MRKVELSYSLTHEGGGEARLGHPLIDLLDALQTAGSIAAAARAMGLSYRHVWGELKRWDAELGQPLVAWEKGQRARLTPFARKLLWAERQAQARVAPQVDAVRGELERAFALAFDPKARVLALFASHDEAVALLREHAATHSGLHLDIRFCGSVDAITALNQGRCTVAGFHTPPHPKEGSLAQRTYQPLLQPGLHKLVGFARRTQGLIVAPGNPLKMFSLVDVARGRVRFANRAIGTGTRLLLDELLQSEGLLASSIRGYDTTEPSHSAVAHAVASGTADAGLGIEPAARALGLGFVPLLQEDYYLACLKDALDEPAVLDLLAVLRSRAWRRILGTLAGYHAAHCGDVLSLTRQLPWWQFDRVRPRRS